MKTEYLLAIAAMLGFDQANGNTLINGDFQTGTLSPSTSSYTQSATMTPEQTWAIVSFDTLHPSWTDFFDHTTGNANGRFMVVNGSNSASGLAWSQQIVLFPNTSYSFSGWFTSVFSASPASLELRVRDSQGLLAVFPFQLPSTTPLWSNQATTFTTGSATSISVQVWDTNTQAFGNDYAIDDLDVHSVPEPSSTLLLLSAAFTCMRRRSLRTNERSA